jgi:hypothetical protein
LLFSVIDLIAKLLNNVKLFTKTRIMKKTICFVLAFLAILIIACNNPDKDTMEYPLQGAWELTYAKWVLPDTTYEFTQVDNPSVKVLTKKHWSLVRQGNMDKVNGAAGEYTYDGDTYTEHVKYHYNSSMVGKSPEYKTSLEGDLLKISTIIMLDSVQVEGTETWKRIIE